MAQTQRTLADLLTNLFQDGQPPKSISPQDVRDLIVSLTPSVGAIHFSAPAETIISAPNTKVLALGTTSLIDDAHGVDMPQNNRIRYTGPITRHFAVDCAIAAQTAGANKTIEYQLFKNGVPLPETLMRRAHAGAGSDGVVALTTNVHMEPDDFIELLVSNESDSTNLTISNGTINLLGFTVE